MTDAVRVNREDFWGKRGPATAWRRIPGLEVSCRRRAQAAAGETTRNAFACV